MKTKSQNKGGNWRGGGNLSYHDKRIPFCGASLPIPENSFRIENLSLQSNLVLIMIVTNKMPRLTYRVGDKTISPSEAE